MNSNTIDTKATETKLNNNEAFPQLFREIATDYFRQWYTIRDMQSQVISFSQENIASIIGECYVQGRLEEKIPAKIFDTEIKKLKNYLETKPQDAISKLFIYNI